MSTTHEEITVALQEEIPADNLKDLIDASLYMPFPFQSNRHESESAAGVDTWLRTWGLTDDPAVAAMIVKTRPAELASYNSPTVDRDVLQIVANQIAYQFIFDDLAEEVGRRRPGHLLPILSESIGILRDGQSPVTPSGRPWPISTARSRNGARPHRPRGGRGTAVSTCTGCCTRRWPRRTRLRCGWGCATRYGR